MITEDQLAEVPGSDVLNKQEEVMARVTAEGFEVISDPDGTKLLLDLDDDNSVKRYENILPLIQKYLVVTERERWASKSGNTHIVCGIGESTKLSIEERLLLQACLGSDPKREFLSLLRVRRGVPDAIRLFRPPNATITHK